MNMLDLPHAILTAEFFDCDGNSYSYIGRWCTNNKEDFRHLIIYCNQNKIPYNYIYRQYQDTKFAIKVYPSTCEIVYLLFTSPWRDKLFVESRR